VRVLAIIQARLGSTRFPQKALADICGRSLIDHVLDRVEACDAIDHFVLAVPKGDGWMHPWATEFECDQNDVLTRFVLASAGWPEHDTLVRITGDCPLWSPAEAERVLALYRSIPGCEYAWNVAPGYVDGEDCEVFSRAALLQAHWHATGEDREHVTPWIRRNYPVATAMPISDRGGLKTSVDTPEDLERVRQLLEAAA
jgi:spore coat polysaccharide biosynthesis protein SpsF (cytidylyltransferase family)